jgi:hypothetical protein
MVGDRAGGLRRSDWPCLETGIGMVDDRTGDRRRWEGGN